MSSLPARMRMIKSKMKELECSQDFYHYKSMGIFQDAQGRLTPQTLVRSGRISNSSGMLWMFSLPASMQKIRSKMKALEWTHFPRYNPMGAIRCPKPNAAFPHPNDGSDKISLRFAHWLRRYSSLKMFTHGRMQGRTHGRRIDRYTISSPCEPSA